MAFWVVGWVPKDAGWPFRAICRATPVVTGVWKALDNVSADALLAQGRADTRISLLVPVAGIVVLGWRLA